MTARGGKTGGLEVALVGGLLLLANVGLWYGLGMSRGGGTDPETLRQVASRLASAGVKGEAGIYYQRYLEQADVPALNRAQVAVAAGKLLKEEGKLEAALGLLYQAEVLAPGSAPAKDAAPVIVELLDRLGLSQSAQTALQSRSRLEAPASPTSAEGAVVARIDGQNLTTGDLDRALGGLPPQVAEKLKEPAQRKQFLQQFVAEELLFRKAQKRSLEKDPEVRRQVESLTRQVVISRMIEEELKDKVRADEGDLKNFYQAHAEEFKGPDGKVLPFEQAQERVKQAYLMSKVQTLSQELLQQALAAQEVQLFPEVLEGKAPTGSAPAGGRP